MAKILVVDDDKQATALIAKLLSLDGFAATEVNDSTKAVAVAGEVKPDLILLDLMMPGLNGFELCEIFKANEEFANIPIIIVSAMEDPVSREHAFKAGAKDYVTKPFLPSELSARVKVMLDKK
jgi:DNA-binding response OmpR family regulator